jgi:hypothetical protein
VEDGSVRCVVNHRTDPRPLNGGVRVAVAAATGGQQRRAQLPAFRYP